MWPKLNTLAVHISVRNVSDGYTVRWEAMMRRGSKTLCTAYTYAMRAVSRRDWPLQARHLQAEITLMGFRRK